MAITTTDIVTEYGAYYINSGQNMARLKRLLLFGRETTKLATKIKTDNTVYRLAQSVMTRLVQAFQKSWTPKGDMTFTPNPIELFHLKVDFEVYPDDVEDNWLGFLASNDLNRKEWPLIRYILESHFYGQINTDMEELEYYKGVYTAPTSGTAGISGQSMNGLKTFLTTDKVNHVTMAALDAATIYDQIELFYESISEQYQNSKMIIGMAPKWKRAFLKDKRSLGYYDITSPSQIDDTLDFSPARVIGLPSMIGTDDIWATPVDNFLHITKKGENAAKVKIEESKRVVNLLTDWWEGLGFGINEVVWTNVAEVVPEP